MADVMRHRWQWTGWPGQPGVSTFVSAGTDAAAFVAGINTFLTACMGTGATGGLVTGVKITPDSFVEIFDSSTGDLISTTGVTPPAALVGGSAQPMAAPAGICVTWITDGIVGTRRVRGRTFLVPLSTGYMEQDGTVIPAKLTQIQTAANAYAAGAWDPAIWHRPPPGGSGGSTHPITAASVRDKIAILTSRRD